MKRLTKAEKRGLVQKHGFIPKEKLSKTQRERLEGKTKRKKTKNQEEPRKLTKEERASYPFPPKKRKTKRSKRRV